MKIIISFNLNKFYRTRFARFGISYWSNFLKKKRKLIPKDNWEKLAFSLFHLAGKTTVRILHLINLVYFFGQNRNRDGVK